MARVFVTGGTGQIGGTLITALVRRGHAVRALARPGSERRLPPGCDAVSGNALEESSYSGQIAPADTFVHLVGVPHPNPTKAAAFRAVDLVSVRAAVSASQTAGVAHFVYVSVAQPAPVMKAYLAVRAEGEALIRAAGLNATIVRPWYVLGPGRRWPLALVPIYWLMTRIPATRDTARRLGLVTLAQMVATLTDAVENPPAGIRIIEVPEIRKAALKAEL
jgi:uncharacterized protein YbjT (DUF2867 family)